MTLRKSIVNGCQCGRTSKKLPQLGSYRRFLRRSALTDSMTRALINEDANKVENAWLPPPCTRHVHSLDLPDKNANNTEKERSSFQVCRMLSAWRRPQQNYLLFGASRDRHSNHLPEDGTECGRAHDLHLPPVVQVATCTSGASGMSGAPGTSGESGTSGASGTESAVGLHDP